jgi:hypothetical protein
MRKLVVVVLLVLMLSAVGYSQQAYVGRFDGYGAYSYFTSPGLNLVARGFNGEFGVNVFRWAAMGFDFSVMDGHTNLGVLQLNPSVKAQLDPLLAALPPGTTVGVPYDARIYTYSAGPQINIRKLKPVTFFIRPALGALHADVTARPNTPLSTALVSMLVGPSGKKSDTVVFYGFGGGIDWNVSKHFAIRTSADFVRMNMFDNLLAGPYNNVRVTVGPTFRFGKNVEK